MADVDLRLRPYQHRYQTIAPYAAVYLPPSPVSLDGFNARGLAAVDLHSRPYAKRHGEPMPYSIRYEGIGALPVKPDWCAWMPFESLFSECVDSLPATVPSGPMAGGSTSSPTPGPTITPTIDVRGTPATNPSYGQVMIGGQVVSTPEQAQQVIAQITTGSPLVCQSPFQRRSDDGTKCQFELSKPASIALVGGALVGLAVLIKVLTK